MQDVSVGIEELSAGLCNVLDRLNEGGQEAADAEQLFEEIEEYHFAIMSAPAYMARHVELKLAIIGRCIVEGADAEHIVRLFDLARASLEEYPHVSATYKGASWQWPSQQQRGSA